MALKELIKIMVSNNKWAQRPYILYVLCKRKMRFKQSTRTLPKDSLVGLKHILRLGLTNKECKESVVAHVIGSGWSLLDSHKKIGKSDFVFGFNFSALSGITSDIYFFELCSKEKKSLTLKQMNLINNHVVNTGAAVYFKNVLEEKNDIHSISKMIVGRFAIAKDLLVPCLSRYMLREVLSFCLDYKGDYVLQYCSTAITCILISYYMGFKQIVVHGVDFYGEHFYNIMDHNESETNHINNCRLKFKHPVSEHLIHKTAMSDQGMRQAVFILSNLLLDRGVKLYSGSINSPSSEYLPVYEPGKSFKN